MLLKKRNNHRLKFFPPEYFISITVLMIWAIVFLKIDTTDTKEILESIENIFVTFDEFYVEFWFYHYSPRDCFLHVWISHIDSKASFTIYEPDNILGTKILHRVGPFGFYHTMTQLTSDAASDSLYRALR
jgi:hypothetical protein